MAIFADKLDPRISKRVENTPAGMKNLGATCYANSLLQVWFHNPAFRDIIYRCRFGKDSDKSMNALYQLQLLFAHLDRGLKKFYSPLSLVSSLRLDIAMQQDAQEFCNLFMARIDGQLQRQEDPELGAFIQNQFQGHYSYNTTCRNCKKTSVKDCTFYELMLNIKDNCTFMDCLEEFVEPEELSGTDRYSCSTCGSLQDASRVIKIDKLPNVLNIQLMRFIYDNVMWTKRKSKDTIRFPETIDFSELLRSNTSVKYELSAVLVHSGPSAHSGHFSAHVLDRESNKWFVLNDEEVAEFQGTKFDPEDYSETAPKTKTKKPSCKSGGIEDERLLSTLSSRNAYMLTYTKRSLTPPIKPCAPPAETLYVVEQDNTAFQNELKEHVDYTNKIKGTFEAARNERRQLYQYWHVGCEEDKGYYVPAESLGKYMQLDSKVPHAIDNSSLVCEHGKICPTMVLKSKRISELAWHYLVDRLQVKIDPILTSDDICEVCTKNVFQDKLYTLMHRKDIEEFERKAKGVRSPLAAWVSKLWLTDWLKVAPRFHQLHKTTAEDASPISEAYIHDVLCPHSALANDKTKRKLINKAALEVITRVFGELPLPGSDALECTICRGQLQSQIDNMKDTAARATSEKQELASMMMRGARLSHMNPGERYYVVSQEGFMKSWLNYVKRPMGNARPTTIDNSSLLCRHGLFVFDLHHPVDAENDEDIFLVKEDEWMYLRALYNGGPEVVVMRTEVTQTDDTESNICSFIETVPSLCSNCRNERILNFDSTTLFIRVYAPGTSTPGDDESATISASNLEQTNPNVQDTLTSTSSAAKRKQGPLSPGPHFGARRSKRAKSTKKQYKEIKVLVGKWDTVMELKLKIMQKTNIVPLYQKLVHKKAELDKNETTIADLEIPPNAVLDLIAFDQSMDDLMLSSLQGKKTPSPTLVTKVAC
ncbi:Ubiquitin carboxyl-terminal hydrolase 48 [Gamsiella multidivaricata]|nr:Ubiquitin carboxyl-terminal hydrolase 48 [Gamsiella multidivaricata]